MRTGQVKIDLFCTYKGGILSDHFSEYYKMDDYGLMPSIEDFMNMRGDNGRSDHYIYMFGLFGIAVYGENVYREVIDPPLGAQQNTVEGRVSMWNERSLKRFTCNDEAWMLLVLQDNWCVWYNKAVDELYAEIRSLSNKEFITESISGGL